MHLTAREVILSVLGRAELVQQCCPDPLQSWVLNALGHPDGIDQGGVLCPLVVSLVGQIVQKVVQHLLPAVELAQAVKQNGFVVPVQISPVQLVPQQSGVNLRIILQNRKDAAGIPERLTPQRGHLLQHPGPPNLFNRPAARIAYDRDCLCISLNLPQGVNLVLHAGYAEVRQHLDQDHAQLWILFAVTGLLEVGLLPGRQRLEFIAALHNLHAGLHVCCPFIQFHQLLGTAVQIQAEVHLLLIIAGDHLSEPAVIPGQKIRFPHQNGRTALVLVVVDHPSPVRTIQNQPSHQSTALGTQG